MNHFGKTSTNGNGSFVRLDSLSYKPGATKCEVVAKTGCASRIRMFRQFRSHHGWLRPAVLLPSLLRIRTASSVCDTPDDIEESNFYGSYCSLVQGETPHPLLDRPWHVDILLPPRFVRVRVDKPWTCCKGAAACCYHGIHNFKTTASTSHNCPDKTSCFKYKHRRDERQQTTLGAAIMGSESIKPQMHQTTALAKFAVTSGPGMALLSFERITAGRQKSMEIAPTKLQKDDTKPVMKRARSTGSVVNAQT